MKDRFRKRTVFSWRGLFFFLTIILLFLAAFASSLLRLCLAGSFQPRLIPKRNIPVMEVKSSENSEPAAAAASVRETVIFPDEAVVFLKYPPSASLFTKDDVNCVYFPPNSSLLQLELSPSAADSDIVRCPPPPRGAVVSLKVKRGGDVLPAGPMLRWDSVAYEALLDGTDNTTVVFAKGLNLRSGRNSDPSKFKCVYSSGSAPPMFADAVSAAQEVVRCRTPPAVLKGSPPDDPVRVSVRVVGRETLGSVARVGSAQRPPPPPPPRPPPPPVGGGREHRMCICTMLRNQARFLPEWIMYHGSLGVERWFVYDNNSEDDVEGAAALLASAGYNVTRHLWPWIKTQEAGFAHCALRARGSCQWVGFVDVDEFLHLPSGSSLYETVLGPLEAGDGAGEVGEVRVACHSFGPSGLKEAPMRGVVAGYTCRLAAPERHKSIVRPEALDSSLINLVHHFYLKPGFRHVNVERRALVINHYKYQVWEVFKEKFHRRVATYVSDWQQERNVGSKDRAPGLGTKAVEPSDWPTRFCEVRDTGLRDRVLEAFSDPQTGYLPWEDQQRIPNLNAKSAA